MAVVSIENKFIWVNHAFERLTGYAASELQKKTWMDITVSDDVPGDLAAVNEIVKGNQDNYSIWKRYRHRDGREVPVALSVWRYPPAGELAMFLAEAPPVIATKADVDQCFSDLADRVKELSDRVDHMSSDRGQSNRSVTTDTNTFNIGNNSTEIMKWIVVAVAVLVSAVAYLIYIGGWSQHGGKADPPKPTISPDFLED